MDARIEYSRKMITKRDVEKALNRDQGTSANLHSFEVKEFMSKGENYASHITSVIVQFDLNGGNIHETSYIVKMCLAESSPMNKREFDSEILFYTQILPKVNKILVAGGEPELRVPKQFHCIETDGQQVIYMEDLRRSGFKMHERRDALDWDHAELIITELARLHAASSLFITETEKSFGKNIEEKFTTLKDFTFNSEIVKGVKFLDVMGGLILRACGYLEQIEGYGHVVEFLKKNHTTFASSIREVLMKQDLPFKVICHGDCWNNNFLFRYSPSGSVVECRILDLQAIHLSSPTTDLSRFIYSSLKGELRKPRLQTLLATYYATYASVCTGASTTTPFTMIQLGEEFKSKNFFGFFWTLLLVPLCLIEADDDTPNLDQLVGGPENEEMKKLTDRLNKKILNSPNLRPRILDMLDEMQENGLFK